MRKLNLKDMWKLYLILQPVLPAQRNEFLVDEIQAMVAKMQWPDLKRSLGIMYGEVSDLDPMRCLLMMIKGLKESNFFLFVEFIDRLK